jgi:hypothetical protein
VFFPFFPQKKKKCREERFPLVRGVRWGKVSRLVKYGGSVGGCLERFRRMILCRQFCVGSVFARRHLCTHTHTHPTTTGRYVDSGYWRGRGRQAVSPTGFRENVPRIGRLVVFADGRQLSLALLVVVDSTNDSTRWGWGTLFICQ